MVDILTSEERSRLMSRIGPVDTGPEMVIRKGLHALGFRYRLHDKRLPGTPDMVFRRYRAIVEVRGCFWHRHECHLFRWPGTRKEFWREKLTNNRQRDIVNEQRLHDYGWRVLVVWECALRGRTEAEVCNVIRKVADWLRSDRYSLEIARTDTEKNAVD